MSSQKQSGVYTVITKEKEMENDRDRIIKKFQFTHTKTYDQGSNHTEPESEPKSNTKTNTKPKQKPVSSANVINTNTNPNNNINTNNANGNKQQANTRNKNLKVLQSQSLSNHYKTQNNTNTNNINNTNTNTTTTATHNIATKDIIIKKNNQSSHFNTILSDDTEKETKSRLMLIKDQITYENIYENESINDDIDNDNNNHNNNNNNNNNDINMDSNEEIQCNKVHFKGGGIRYLPVSNDSSEYSGNNSNSNSSKLDNNSSNINGLLIQNYDKDRIRYIGMNYAKAKKMRQLFFSNPSYEVSTRLLNDELTNYNYNQSNAKCFRFIKEVQHSNDQIQQIKLNSFLKLSDCGLYHLLSFCYESFDHLIYNQCKVIGSKIHLSLCNLYESVIESFKSKYQHIIKLEAYYFKQKTFKHFRGAYPILDLVLRVKVISKDVNASYEIGYSYISNGVLYNEKWKFDLRKDIRKIWLASEYAVYNQTVNRFTYTQPIASFCCNDIIELRMNLFSMQSIVNPFSIKWEDIVIKEAPKGFYEKSVLKCPYAFDCLYACEIENMVHFWKKAESKDNVNGNGITNVNANAVSVFISNFKRLYTKHFTISDIGFDSSRIMFYKITLKASNEGRIKRNHYVNFDIEIVSQSKSIKNEIQTIGLLNSTLLTDCIQIRKGTIVLLYITELIQE